MDNMAFIAASEKPNTAKSTSLQLKVFCFNCSKSCSFDNVSAKFSVVQAKDSLKKTLLYAEMIKSQNRANKKKKK